MFKEIKILKRLKIQRLLPLAPKGGVAELYF